MKNLIIALFLIVHVSVFAQQEEYKISSYLIEGTKAPNTHYIGEAWLNGLLTAADGDINYNITKATFKANSTLDWHKHSSAQVLIYVDGQG